MPDKFSAAIALLMAIQAAAVEVWVGQLGDPRFTVRDEATKQLAATDVPVFGQLARARTSKDLEVRARAKRATAAAVARIRNREVARALDWAVVVVAKNYAGEESLCDGVLVRSDARETHVLTWAAKMGGGGVMVWHRDRRYKARVIMQEKGDYGLCLLTVEVGNLPCAPLANRPVSGTTHRAVRGAAADVAALTTPPAHDRVMEVGRVNIGGPPPGDCWYEYLDHNAGQGYQGSAVFVMSEGRLMLAGIQKGGQYEVINHNELEQFLKDAK